MRILIRTSKWAIWARRAGGFALPLAAIPIFMHRERLIDTDTFELIELVAVATACLALVLAVGAVARLWITGDRGWGRALTGAALALICLAPFGFGLSLALRYPRLDDVSTDFSDPPVLISGVVPAPITPERGAALKATFPNVQPRTYPLEAPDLFAIAEDFARTRGWDIRLRREPQSSLDEGQLNAIVMRALGWRDEVSIRIVGSVNGSRLDMRSAPLHATHDLGSNGNRVEEFLVALDAEVSLRLRDMPAVPAAPPPG